MQLKNNLAGREDLSLRPHATCTDDTDKTTHEATLLPAGGNWLSKNYGNNQH